MSDIEDIASDSESELAESIVSDEYISDGEDLNEEKSEIIYTFNDVKGNEEKNISHDKSDDESEEDSEEENDEELFKIKKLNDEMINYHTEHNLLSFDEIKPLLRVQRNKNNIIIDENHSSVAILTKYEYTKVIGLRVVQLENGLKPFITVDKGIIDPLVIASQELKEKKLPFIIKRPISMNKYEYWPLQELEILE